MILDRDEEIAALEVLSRQIKDRLEDLKGEVKHELLFDYSEGRSDRKPVMVGGTKVGSYMVVAPAMKAVIVPGREDEALRFLDSLGLAELSPIRGWEKHFANIGGTAIHRDSGEICDAISFDYDKAPYMRTVGFKPDVVREAFQAVGIGSGEVLALIGGSDDV